MSTLHLNLMNPSICQYLPISDYAHLTQTCKNIHTFCIGSASNLFYWKQIYQLCYSAIGENESSWKNKVKQVEDEIKKIKIFSNKFQVCLDLKCEKLGSLRESIKQTKPEVLTSCLKSLLKHTNTSIELKQIFAEKLLAAGANPMQRSNIYVEDSPLTIAVLENQQSLISLFLKYIDINEENCKHISKLIKRIFDNNFKLDVSKLEGFLKTNIIFSIK